MRYLLLFVLCAIFAFANAQEEDERYRKVANAFMASYNQEDYASVYEMFNPEMQEFLSLEKTAEFLGKNIRGGAGDLKQMNFEKKMGPSHVYKSTFELGVRDIYLSLDKANRISGMQVKPHVAQARLDQNTTPMDLPFQGEWFVFWGGETEVQNYHMADVNQQFAYDILKVANGASYEGDPSENESYFAFGEPILAPCDARVEMAVDGVPDNIPGETNPIYLTGNTLVLKTKAGEYILMCHLMQGSLEVERGDWVSQGQVLAKCGNSGNSTEAHLHLQLQNTRDIHKATGARLVFNHILVNGTPREGYIPVKEDYIKRID
jgi:hypothetical protein